MKTSESTARLSDFLYLLVSDLVVLVAYLWLSLTR